MPSQNVKKEKTKKSIPKILWVDDDPNVISVVRRSLRPYFVEVLSAYNGMQGIWLTITEKPDLIVTDLSMPIATGNDLIETLSNNATTRDTPLLVVTGLAPTQQHVIDQQHKVMKVFFKPTPFTEILEEIQKFMPLQKRFKSKPAA